jgi:hypothetical protein
MALQRLLSARIQCHCFRADALREGERVSLADYNPLPAGWGRVDGEIRGPDNTRATSYNLDANNLATYVYAGFRDPDRNPVFYSLQVGQVMRNRTVIMGLDNGRLTASEVDPVEVRRQAQEPLQPLHESNGADTEARNVDRAPPATPASPGAFPWTT